MSREHIESYSTGPRPRIAVLEHIKFPIKEAGDILGHRVLHIPPLIRDLFTGGYHAVRISSLDGGVRLPHYGGETPDTHSLLPHQDHFPTDKRRFLAFSKHDNEARGSSTYMLRPEIAAAILPQVLSYFENNTSDLKNEATYRDNYLITREEFDECFKDGGIQRVLKNRMEMIRRPTLELELFSLAGLLTYCIGGKAADKIVADMLKEHGDKIAVEKWETKGVLIIDNANSFHGRAGNNTSRLQKNWLV